jgi:hypothetical protein
MEVAASCIMDSCIIFLFAEKYLIVKSKRKDRWKTHNKCKDYIKMNLKEILWENMGCFHLAQNTVH